MKPSEKTVALEIVTPQGTFVAAYSLTGLCELRFPRTEDGPFVAQPTPLPASVKHWHDLTSKSLRLVLAGQKPGLLPPLDLSAGSDFQKRVWAGMQEIPWGGTLSYQELANLIGNPKACRTVGGACGANPIPVFIPCHRVLAANRRLGGFSGGLDWKKKLLALEGSWTPDMLVSTETAL